MKQSFAEAVSEWNAGFTKLNEQYASALEKLQTKLQAAGKLDQVLLVKGERESFLNSPRSDQIAPKELSDLVNIYDRAKSKWESIKGKKLMFLTTEYLKGLEELVKRFTKEDKIEKAVLVRNEIERFKGISSDPKKLQLELDVGPAALDARKIKILSGPDGILSERRSGRLIFMGIGDSLKLQEPTANQAEKFIKLESDYETWAALTMEGRLISSPLDGEGIPLELKEVIWFRVGAGMVIAFHSDGTMSTFGKPQSPEDQPPADLNRVLQFSQDQGSGIALLENGNVKVWGSMYQDENARKKIEDDLKDAQFVSSTETGGWALDAEGQVLFWAKGARPRVIDSYENVAKFCGGKSDFLILHEDGTVEGGSTVGNPDPVSYVPDGQRKGIDIKINYWGYALQFHDGTWITWGGPSESAPLHAQCANMGKLLDLAISAAPKKFVIIGLKN